MMIKVSSNALKQMHELADAAYPHEACGLMLGRDGQITQILPAANVHPSPQRHFEIDPQTLIDAHRAARGAPEGAQILGYYHSHPDGPARPSKTDTEMAHGDGMIWAIFGEEEIGFWRDGRANEGSDIEPVFTLLSYSIYDG